MVGTLKEERERERERERGRAREHKNMRWIDMHFDWRFCVGAAAAAAAALLHACKLE